MSNVVQKFCVVCEKDVSGEKRVKDPQGRYYCQACAESIRARAGQRQEVVPMKAPAAPAVDEGEIDLAPVVEVPKPKPRIVATRPGVRAPQEQLPMDGPLCPCCEQNVARGAKICVRCGIRVPSGKPIITALGRDENMLYANGETIIRAIAWLLWLGFYPIASEAYATKKPYVIWAVAILTTIISIGFFAAWRMGDDMKAKASQLMLWPMHQTARTDDELLSVYRKHANDLRGEAMREMAREVDMNPKDTDEQRVLMLLRQIESEQPKGEFQPYQLLTNIFLHDPSSIFRFIMHLGGNMLFLLIFGTRVNALIGNVKTAILYPLLGVAASAAHLFFHVGRSGPALGASGAIMGLAGMYLIFFPVHRVYMAFWLKIFWRIPAWIKIWPMRGFWVLLIWISFDVISTLLRSQDGVAHWAHLGGFIAGMAVALFLLVTRMDSANHGDLLSVVLGRWSWPLIGKPKRVVTSVVVG